MKLFAGFVYKNGCYSTSTPSSLKGGSTGPSIYRDLEIASRWNYLWYQIADRRALTSKFGQDFNCE